MLERTTERAYAKVNFGLKVFPKREDGFHNIESVFQTIDLYNTLEISVANTKGCEVICLNADIPKENTLTKAYQAFCQIATVKVSGVKVQITKGIPDGGGLGGSSSDAAALVRGLEKLCGITLSTEQLDFIADKTGTNKIEYGSSITINITPNENFEIASIKVNGETIEITNSLVINNITKDMDIFIEFKSTIIEPETPNNQPSDQIDNSDEQKNNKVVWIIVGSVFAVDAVAAATFTIIKLKKKQDK